jgi:hypothetical protein
MLSEGRLHPEIRRYTAYLKVLREDFHAVAELFDLWSPPGSAGSKGALRLTNPDEMLYLANHLFILDQAGVPGVVLECGCAHGFSSICLSLACARLGRRLVVADSFEGLPATRSEEPFFRQGDYAAREEEVLENVALCGRPEVIETVKGWYSQSLRAWSRPIVLLWMDVDLYESARDLLDHVACHIDPRGALFTHEFTDFYGNPYARGTLTVPGAIYEWYDRNGRPCRARAITRYWGIVGGTAAIQMASPVCLDMLLPHLRGMDSRHRAWRELRECRTVRLAFVAKRLLSRRWGRTL